MNRLNKLNIYNKPIYYSLIHVLFGILFVRHFWIGIVFIIYQILQLILNKRFFLFQYKIENGNSINHTLFKLFEFFIGIIIGLVVL